MMALAQCNIGGEDSSGRGAASVRRAGYSAGRGVRPHHPAGQGRARNADGRGLAGHRDRQWFKSKQGVKAAETPRNISFCTDTIQGTKPLIVNDAHTDPRFANSPLVTGDPHIRFYVGVPLRSRDGYNVGALCSMDTEVRDLTPEQVTVLEDLGPADRRRTQVAHPGFHRCG